MERFRERKSLSGTLQPGDGTRYEMVAVQMHDCVEVVVMNEGFFDRITFVGGKFYHSHRGNKTNPWTIKAAKEMVDRIHGEYTEVQKD